jgi:LPXTG-motif cell wall-anchored protein
MNRFLQIQWFLIGLLALLLPARVLAHGGGVAQITDAPAGPYRVFAWTSPDPWRAGEDAHVTVAVTRVDAGQTFPVTDAQVTLRLFMDSQPDQTLTLQATPVSAVAAGFYEVDHKLPRDGLWRVEVNVQGDEGVGSVSFAMQVAPAATNNWFVWAGGALALLAVIGFLFGARKRPGARAVSTQRATPSSVVQE